jgi:hypothetical protein
VIVIIIAIVVLLVDGAMLNVIYVDNLMVFNKIASV